MKLIVGLGNPGKNYVNTRHNVGFMVIDSYITGWFKEKFQGLFLKTIVDGEEVIFLKPITYMNLSGNSIGRFMKYYKINIEDVLIVQDDLDMGIGTYKLKKNSSSGGHNGIKSIEKVLGTKDFARLKIGIKNQEINDVKDFVLNKFNKKEQDIINNIDTNKIIDMFIKYGYDYTINKYKE